MPVALNSDCWILIVECIGSDFCTLSRLLRVSWQLFGVAAPRLYGHLGHSSSKQEIDSWSLCKRDRVASLIFTSSGFLNPVLDGFIKSDFREEVDRCGSSFLCMPMTRKGKTLVMPIYHTPLTTNYFGLIKRLPEDLVTSLWPSTFVFRQDVEPEQVPDKSSQHNDNASDNDSNGSDGYNKRNGRRCLRSTRYLDVHNAEVLTCCKIVNMGSIKRLLPHVERFSQLETIRLRLDEAPDEAMKDCLISFITAHKIAFPGRLLEVHSRDHMELLLQLNNLLKPTRLDLPCTANVPALHSPIYENLCALKFGTQLGSNVDAFKDPNPMLFISRATKVKELDIEAGVETNQVWIDSVTKTIELAKAFKANAEANGTPLLPRPPPCLTSLRTNKLHLSVASVLARGFRTTLSAIDIVGSNAARQGISWQRPFARLTVLNLDHCSISHSTIAQICPNLEELRLRDVFQQDHGGTWTPPKSLKVLHLHYGHSAEFLNLTAFGDLSLLQDLKLWHEVDDVADRIETVRTGRWRLEKLERLSLGRTVYHLWERKLLNAAPNLKYLEAPGAPVAYLNWILQNVNESHCHDPSEEDFEDEGEYDEFCLDSRPNASISKIEILNFRYPDTCKLHRVIEFFDMLALCSVSKSGPPKHFPCLRQLILPDIRYATPTICDLIVRIMGRSGLEVVETFIPNMEDILELGVQILRAEDQVPIRENAFGAQFNNPPPFCVLKIRHNSATKEDEYYRLWPMV